QLPQSLAQARSVEAAGLVTIEARFDRSNFRLHRLVEFGHRRKILCNGALWAPAWWSRQRCRQIHHALAIPCPAGGSNWISEAKAVTANRPAKAITLASMSGLPLAPSERAAVAPAAPAICMK